MAIKKLRINQKTVSGYDVLYPETSADQVFFADGSNAEAHKNDNEKHVSSTEKTKWNKASNDADKALVDIGNKTNLLTTNKASLVGAVNELFTSASNGKIAVANAVTNMGVSASPNDTFPVLANKIGQIYTGKKFAEGTFTSGTGSSYTASVSNLGFRPKIIMVKQADGYGNFSSSSYAWAVYNEYFSTTTGEYNYGNSRWFFSPTFTVNDSGFSLTLLNPDDRRNHKWIAFE